MVQNYCPVCLFGEYVYIYIHREMKKVVSYVFQPAGILVKVAETVILDPTNKGTGMFLHKKEPNRKTLQYYEKTS